MKTRVVASVAWTIEVTDEEIDAFLKEDEISDEDELDVRNDIAHEIAYNKLQKLTFGEASWDNIHDWETL